MMRRIALRLGCAASVACVGCHPQQPPADVEPPVEWESSSPIPSVPSEPSSEAAPTARASTDHYEVRDGSLVISTSSRNTDVYLVIPGVPHDYEGRTDEDGQVVFENSDLAAAFEAGARLVLGRAWAGPGRCATKDSDSCTITGTVTSDVGTRYRARVTAIEQTFTDHCESRGLGTLEFDTDDLECEEQSEDEWSCSTRFRAVCGKRGAFIKRLRFDTFRFDHLRVDEEDVEKEIGDPDCSVHASLRGHGNDVTILGVALDCSGGSERYKDVLDD